MVCRRHRSIPILIGFAILHILLLVSADHDGSDDPLDWLRESIPGEPGVDYPIFSEVETTAFSCKDRVFGGYYADPEMQCQGYHVCLSSQFMPGIADRKMSFLCPNGTIFSQALFTCDWWFNVDCSETEDLYAGNAIIGDENARIGGDTASSNKGQGRQSGERRSTNNNNSRKPSSKANSSTQRNRPTSKKPVAPAKEPAKNRSQPKANTRPRQQANASPRRKPSNTNGNGRKKKPGVRKIKKKKGARRKPQSPKEAEVEAPQSVENDADALPDYDIGLDGLADYKPTKGVGSSSVQGGVIDIPADSATQDQDVLGLDNVEREGPTAIPSQKSLVPTVEDDRPTFEPTFDIVQYDAEIPDGEDDLGFGDGVPILLADPFAGFKNIDIDDTDTTGTRQNSNRRTGPEGSVSRVTPPPELQLYSVPKRERYFRW